MYKTQFRISINTLNSDPDRASGRIKQCRVLPYNTLLVLTEKLFKSPASQKSLISMISTLLSSTELEVIG